MNDNEIEFYVRFNEQDDMGIVHNSVYYIWFEMARNNFAYHILDADYQELKKWALYYQLFILNVTMKSLQDSETGFRLHAFMSLVKKTY